MQTYEEYMRSFEKETRDLIVYISWIKDKALSNPEEVEGMLKMRAGFDNAIDVSSGEFIRNGRRCWLEWVYRKKLFGDPFGFSLKKGSQYMLRVRRKITDNPAAAEIYYVEEVLQKDIMDRRLDPVLSFLDSFEEKEQEMLFLNKQEVFGWGVFHGYKRIGLTYLARKEMNDTEIHEETGHLFLLEKNSDSSLKAKFKELTVYRLLVRASREKPDTYLIVRNLGTASPGPFQGKIDEYRRPVRIDNELGSFLLDRRYSWFEGTVQWCAQPCSVLLNVPEGSTDCSASMEVLRQICQDSDAFDANIRKQTCDQTWDLLGDWYEEEITKEEYMKRMGIPQISISEDGDIEFSFETGELYAEHVLIVSVDAQGNVQDAYLAG